jgi:hypothetical protein
VRVWIRYGVRRVVHAEMMAHAPTTPTKRLVPRAVLNDVSPIVARGEVSRR